MDEEVLLEEPEGVALDEAEDPEIVVSVHHRGRQIASQRRQVRPWQGR